MSEEVTITDDLLDDYMQIGNSEPTDSTKPGTNVQLIDLTEILAEEEGTKLKTTVSGLEELSLGVLSREVGVKLKLRGVEQFDPFPSEFNARLGKESFFGGIISGIEKAITWVIKFVRNCIMWVVNLIKSLLGYTPSERQQEIVAKGTVKLREELVAIARKLGVPEDLVNPERYFATLPADKLDFVQIEYLGSKLRSDRENLESINEVLVNVPKLVKKLEQSRRVVERAINNYTKVINEEYVKFLKVKGDTKYANRTGAESTEVSNILIALNDSLVKVELKELGELTGGLIKDLTGKEIKEETLKEGIGKVIKEYDAHLGPRVVNAYAIYGGLAPEVLLRRGNALARDAISSLKVDVKVTNREYSNLSQFTSIDQAQKVAEIDTYYKQNGTMVGIYTEAVNFTRDYMALAVVANDALLRARAQANAIISWCGRMEVFVTAALADDLDTIRTMGINVNEHDLTTMTGYDAETFREKMSTTVNKTLEQNFLNIKSIVANLKKQARIK